MARTVTTATRKKSESFTPLPANKALRAPPQKSALELAVEKLRSDFDSYQELPDLPHHSVDDLPSASPAGRRVYVTDEVGGAITAFSDGVDWRRESDRRVVMRLPRVIIFNGQSNMAALPEGTLGVSSTSRLLGPDLFVFNEVTQTFTQAADAGANSKYSTGAGAGQYGTLLMRRIADQTGDSVRAFCLAYSSQGITYFLPASGTAAFFGDNTQHATLNNYNLLKAQVATSGVIPELYVLCQGEADAGTSQAAYYANLKTLFDQTRIDYPGIKWLIVATIGDANDRGSGGGPCTGIRGAAHQLAAENPGVVFVQDNADMLGSTVYFDGVHYNHIGYEESAERSFGLLRGDTPRPDVNVVEDILDVFSWTEYFSGLKTVSLGRVTQWASDIPPNTTVMVPHTNSPEHVSADSEFNNNSVIKFNRANAETLKLLGLTATDSWTLFCVAKTDLLGATQHLMAVQDAGNANRMTFEIVGQSNQHQYFYDGGGASFTGTPGYGANIVRPHSFCFIHDFSNTMLLLYVDGDLFGTATVAGTESQMTDVWLGSLIGTNTLEGRVACYGFGRGVIATPSEVLNMHRAVREIYKLAA